jgi:hypothetical protein
MGTGKLKKPSRELAARILSEVGFENHLAGFSLRERSGAVPVIMYHFEEVLSFLDGPFPCLDWRGLETWLKNVMGDQELAEKIAEAVQKGKSERDRCFQVKKQMRRRLDQCKKLA